MAVLAYACGHCTTVWHSSDPATGACRQLDYYCRLDTDSRINAPVPIDMFNYMAANGLHYGFVRRSTERGGLAEGMW